MKPHIEISKQLQDLYGPNRIVIGKAGEKIYFDLPDSPEVFAHLIKRMFQALAVRDMGDHLHALAQQMEEMISPPLTGYVTGEQIRKVCGPVDPEAEKRLMAKMKEIGPEACDLLEKFLDGDA